MSEDLRDVISEALSELSDPAPQDNLTGDELAEELDVELADVSFDGTELEDEDSDESDDEESDDEADETEDDEDGEDSDEDEPADDNHAPPVSGVPKEGSISRVVTGMSRPGKVLRVASN